MIFSAAQSQQNCGSSYKFNYRKSNYRVAIIGGGPAGCACALALAQAGVTDIVIVEAGDYSQFRIGESIPSEALLLMQALDIDQAFLQENHAPCFGNCSYWGSDKRGYNDAIMNPLGHGWHLDRSKFNLFLAMQASERGVHLLPNTKLSRSIPDATGFNLALTQHSEKNKNSLTIHADFVVDASGTRAVFARQRGSFKLNDLSLVCMAARFPVLNHEKLNHEKLNHEKLNHKNERSGLTHLEAVEQGWWYGAHLPDQSLLLTFYSHAATVKARRLQHTENWLALLAAATNSMQMINNNKSFDNKMLSDVRVAGGIQSFVAPSYCLNQISGHSWLAIGDAASAWDPITSQGISKAIANGIAAAQVIGNPGEEFTFAQTIKKMHQDYLAMRSQLYQLEQRWPESSFWKKQHL